MASNTLSINKIISMFEDIANRHMMIHAFSYGPLSDINTEGELKMPYLHIENTNSVISTGNGITYREVFFDFDVYVMDRINKGDSNYQETTSDTLFILHSIIAEISQHPYYVDAGLRLVDDITTEAVFEVTDENVNGHRATLRLKQGFRYTPCTVPIQDIASYSFNLNGVTEIYMNAGAQGPEGPQGPQGVQGATGPQGVTGPQGNQGPIGPTGPSVEYAVTGTASAVLVTGTTSNTLSQSLLIPAGARTAGQVPTIVFGVRKFGGSNTHQPRLYWNTSPSLIGAILIASNAAHAAAIQSSYTIRDISIEVASGSGNGSSVFSAISNSNNFYGAVTAVPSNVAINWTTTGYFIVAIQNASTTDSSICLYISLK